MIKKLLFLLLLFPLNSSFGQKSLEEAIDEIQDDDGYFSAFHYYHEAGEIEGVSIQNEPQILERLQLETLEFGDYFLTGKYEINSLIVLFVSNYWETEDVHFALLFDESLNLIDRLDQTAYENAEGFYSARSYIHYNILETTTFNEYTTPNYTRQKYTITRDGFIPIVDHVVIDNPSGCRVYEEPSNNSVTLTWANQFDSFDYLGHDYETDSTQLTEEGYLRLCYYEVAENGSNDRFGYVYVGSAERHIQFSTDDYNVVVKEISEEAFQAEEAKKGKEPEVEKITDVDEIEKILGEQLTVEYNAEYEYYEIKEIVADNGQKIDLYWPEYGVSAYFPTYHYLLLEGGHSTEYLVDLKNGDDDIEQIGNPDYYLPSPNGTFRLNGYYSGQANVHFVEKCNDNGEPEYLFSFSSLLALDFIETYFWTDDNTLILKIEGDYFRAQIRAK